MKHRSMTVLRAGMLLLSAALFGALVWLLWQTVPWAAVRWGILGLCAAIFAVVGLWAWYQRRQVSLFADDLCETLDALMSGRTVEGYQPYEDSLTAKVQGKLMQYFDIMNEGKRQSQRDKETIQGLVSDISHQVKTPIANIKMFTGILRGHDLPPEKRAEFLATMDGQIDKLDFLMQSLIKMSRLETGTFTLHMEEARLSDTIAQAMSTVWAKAEAKGIDLSAECDGAITVQHDPKWTAEAIGNILDNAVKYTPPLAVLHAGGHHRHRHRHPGRALQRCVPAVLPRPGGSGPGGRGPGAVSCQWHHHPAEGIYQCKIESRGGDDLLYVSIKLSKARDHRCKNTRK